MSGGHEAAADGAPPLRVRTEPLGGGDLTRDALAGTTPAAWYPPMPSTRAEWRARVDAVREQFAAGAWLELVAPALAATGAAAERLERTAKGAGVVVTTGQQPGLFGGPMYTWSKALSALALADQIEAATGTPTAPVFWAATDDADFDEASVTAIAVGARCTTLRAARTAPEGTPMSHVPLGDDVAGLLDELALGAGSAAYGVALDVARDAYGRGATVGSAYVTLLRTLLAPLGIAVLDASHATARDAGFNLLRRALMKAADIERAVQERTAEIEAAGYRPQVPDVAGRTLVFATAADGTKARVPVAEARAIVTRAQRGSLGPNVLLRPVMERYVLPTVAYVAGPGELAYFAQVSAVADAMAVPAPLAVPRWSGTVLEPHVQRALARLDLRPEDLADSHAPERRVGEEALPAEIRARLMALRTVIDAGIDNLAAADAGDSLLPAAALDGARRALGGRVDRLERRYLAAARRQATDAMQHLLTARAALYPNGTRQERALNAIPLLARHGPALWHAMLSEARPHAAALVDGTPTDAVTHA
jgi:bacillithiol biosynthesis cysteine-adding enzyme BshC